MSERFKPSADASSSKRIEDQIDDKLIETLNQDPDDEVAYKQLGDQLYAFKSKEDFERLEKITDVATRLKAMRDLISIADSPSMRFVAGLAKEVLRNAVVEVERMTDANKKIVAILALSGIIENEIQQSLWASLSEHDIAKYVEQLPQQELWQLREIMRYGDEAQRRVVYSHISNIPREDFPVMGEHLQGIERYVKSAKFSFFDGIQDRPPKALKKEFASYAGDILDDYLRHPIDGDLSKTISWLVDLSYGTSQKVFTEAFQRYCEECIAGDNQEKARKDLAALAETLESLASGSLRKNIFRAIKSTIEKFLK